METLTRCPTKPRMRTVSIRYPMILLGRTSYRSALRGRLQHLRSLHLQQTRTDLPRELKLHIRRASRAKVLEEALSTIASIIILVGLVVMLGVSIAHSPSGILAHTITIFSYLLGVLISWVIYSLAMRLPEPIGLTLIFGSSMLFLGLGYAFSDVYVAFASDMQNAVALSLLYGGWPVVWALVFLITVYPVVSITRLLALRTHPHSIAVARLISLAAWLRNPRVWQDLESKRSIIHQLEFTARVIQKDFPRKLNALDTFSDEWFRGEAVAVAAAIRDWKKFAYSPEADTREAMSSQVIQLLTTIHSGEWRTLPRGEPPQITPSTVRSRILRMVTTVAQAVLPVALLFTWRLTPLAPQEPLFSKLAISVIAICSLYLLLSIDPSAETKFRGASSLADLFLRGGRDRT
jgi:hypothetical protein